MNRNLEVISKAVSDKLETHAQVIHGLIAAQRRGAAELFGYTFLAGRALLQAKSIVPNGHSHLPNAGFKNWVAANFPEITVRTAENWMLFAESILARAQVDACGSPLLLGTAEINCSAHDSILRLVPEIMDGKGMMRFMRDSRLLRTPRRGRPPARRAEPGKVLAENAARARRLWDHQMIELEKKSGLLSQIERVEDLNRYLSALVATSNKVRGAIKDRKGARLNSKRIAA